MPEIPPNLAEFIPGAKTPSSSIPPPKPQNQPQTGGIGAYISSGLEKAKAAFSSLFSPSKPASANPAGTLDNLKQFLPKTSTSSDSPAPVSPSSSKGQIPDNLKEFLPTQKKALKLM